VVHTTGSLDEFCSIFLQRRNDEIHFRGKVVMNTGLPNTDCLGNIRITKAEVPLSAIRSCAVSRIRIALLLSMYDPTTY
jgi:hypothetical protein